MVLYLLLSFFLFSLTLALPTTPYPSPSKSTSIGASCHSITLTSSFHGPPPDHYSEITAICQRDLGGERKSTFNLNKVIGNFNGELKWDIRGGFVESCFDCRLRRHASWKQFTVLHCTCKRAGEQPPVWFPSHTEIDLNDLVVNVDGALKATGVPTQLSGSPAISATAVPQRKLVSNSEM